MSPERRAQASNQVVVIPTTCRTTAGEFMGQTVPRNYGLLVFAAPLPKREEFDQHLSQSMDSVQMHQEALEKQRDLEKALHKAEVSQDPTAGGSGETKELGEGPAPAEESHGTSSKCPILGPYDEDAEMEVAAEECEAEDYEGDEPMIIAATTSFSASNPWVLYDANVFCARDENGQVERSRVGEKTIVLREWRGPLTNQRFALRRQGITRPEWECLPWTGHLCCGNLVDTVLGS
eukprot:s194_g22.t1